MPANTADRPKRKASSHPATVADQAAERPKGRPVHPAVMACEALVSAIVTIDDDQVAFEHGSRALSLVGRALHERAIRIRERCLPEVREGYQAAEAVVASRAAA